MRRGGNINDGANYGPSYVNANNAPSNGNANYGGGLFLTSHAQREACVTLRVSIFPLGAVMRPARSFPGFRKELKLSDWTGLVVKSESPEGSKSI